MLPPHSPSREVCASHSCQGRSWWQTSYSLCWLLLLLLVSLTGTGAMLYPCPDICICLSDTKVLCNGAKLEEIPRNVPPSVEELSFSRNKLSNLSTEMFQAWPRLSTITLDSNQIRSLQPFVFKGLHNLKQISVQNNPLTELTEFSFAGIENVTHINLSNNLIKVIHENVFTGSHNIGMLLLNGNPIVRVRAKAFAGLRTVQFLYLPSRIKVLEADAFFGLHGIGLLKLQSLELHALRAYTFRGLNNVTQISIQDSNLGVFKREAFAGLRNVGEIRILNNKVDTLEALSVGAELNVDGVLVQGNHFLQVEGPNPLTLEANQRNVINGNFFPCTCQLLWVLESPVTQTDPHFLGHNFCVSPYSLHGSNISYVNRSSLDHCSEPPQQISSSPRTTSTTRGSVQMYSTSSASRSGREGERRTVEEVNTTSGATLQRGSATGIVFVALVLFILRLEGLGCSLSNNYRALNYNSKHNTTMGKLELCSCS